MVETMSLLPTYIDAARVDIKNLCSFYSGTVGEYFSEKVTFSARDM